MTPRGPEGKPARGTPGGRSLADRFCNAVDAVNRVIGVVLGLAVILVTFVVIYEVIARGVFNLPTTWANETTVYLSAILYLLAGGYALLHRAHVRIDVIYERLSPRTRVRLDLLTFVFFVIYTGILVWIGLQMGLQSFAQGETTGTPWNPVIWPVKLAIPGAGLLLLLQGLANLLRELGVASPPAESVR